MLGFGYFSRRNTYPAAFYQRRNAVGNAFAVPVITRLLVALASVLSSQASSACPLSADQSPAAPYRHDVLDDNILEAAPIALDFSDLTLDMSNITQ